MKRTLIIVSALLLLLILLPVAAWWVIHRPVPALDGTEYIPGLETPVTVTFDAHAVPYIDAHDELDAYAAQGYVTARERMFQMDILRRTAAGELSEIFGLSALATDRLMRTIGIHRVASDEYKQLSAPTKAAIDSYTKGVNAYLGNSGGKLPLEFAFLGYTPRPWQPEDCLAVLKYQAYKADESWRLDDFRQRVFNKVGAQAAAELFRDDLTAFGLPQTAPPAGQTTTAPGTGEKPATGTNKKPASGANKKPAKKTPPVPIADGRQPGRGDAMRRPPAGETPERALIADLAKFADAAHKFDNPRPHFGSASWAVPASMTSTHGVLLACDKDSAFVAPTEWYLCSINCPSMHVLGATLPGVPGILLGRNENIAWGSANMKADVQDIFLEQFKSQFDPAYQTSSGWTHATLHTESIPVRFGRDVEHNIWTTKHGPVLLRNNQAAVSLAWTGLNASKPAFESIYKLNHANGWQDFVGALSKYSDPPQMFVYADRWGNTGLKGAGDIPIRAGGGTGTMLNNGWQGKCDWTGYVAADQLPQAQVQASDGTSRLPLVAANQQPASAGNLIPHIGSDVMLGHQFNPPYRANRLLTAIATAKNPLTLRDMNLLQGDQYSLLFPTVTKALQEAATQSQLVDGNCLRAISMLLKSDGQLKADSPQGSVFEAFVQTVGRRLAEPQLGRDLATEYLQRWPMWRTQVERVLRDKPPAMLPPEERTYNTFVITSLTQGLKSMRITFNNTDMTKWPWGHVHHALFQPVGWAVKPWYNSYLELGPVYTGGSADSVNAFDVTPDPDALSYAADTGPVQRMLLDMSDRDKIYQSVATGQSGHLFSPYRHDQLSAWVHVDLAPLAFSQDQLMRQAKHRLTLDNQYSR